MKFWNQTKKWTASLSVVVQCLDGRFTWLFVKRNYFLVKVTCTTSALHLWMCFLIYIPNSLQMMIIFSYFITEARFNTFAHLYFQTWNIKKVVKGLQLNRYDLYVLWELYFCNEDNLSVNKNYVILSRNEYLYERSVEGNQLPK